MKQNTHSFLHSLIHLIKQLLGLTLSCLGQQMRWGVTYGASGVTYRDFF